MPTLCVTLALTLTSAGRATATPAAESSAMGPANAAFTEAEDLLDADDPDGAIKRFEAGLEFLPQERGYAPTRAQILLTIVETHEAEFKNDGKLKRLRLAKELLDRYLGPLDLLDEQGRADAEARRVVVIDTILKVEKRRMSEDAARYAAARRETAKAARLRARTMTLAGSILAGAGAAGLGTMGAGVGVGFTTDDKITALKKSKEDEGEDWNLRCTDDDDSCRTARRDELDPLVSRGNAGNIMVIVGAATGGALVVSGIALLLIGRKKKAEAKELEVRPTLSVNAWGPGLEVRF